MAGPRPGEAAQLTMSTRPRSRLGDFDYAGPPRLSAVLILLYPHEAELSFVLTVRTNTVAHHKGQVSLPGGAWEERDGSLAQTALREAEEELGISLAKAELLGELTGLYIAPSHYELRPYVAHIASQPAFQPSSDEVAQLLQVPLAALLDPARRHVETWTIRGREVEVAFFYLLGHKVWGATAMVLSEFAAMLESASHNPAN